MASTSELVEIGEGVWTATAPLVFMGLRLGARMVVARAAEGGLLVHSPIPIDDALASAIDAVGPVRVIVAPSKVHHLFAKSFAATYPRAVLFGAPGLGRKRRDLELHGELVQDERPAELPADFEYVVYDGAPLMNEVVLLHRPSRTLMLTDLAFNVLQPKGWWTRSYLRWSGAYQRFGQSKIVKLSTRNRDLARASVDRMLDLEFERVTVAHGDVLERGGKDALRSAFSWL